MKAFLISMFFFIMFSAISAASGPDVSANKGNGLISGLILDSLTHKPVEYANAVLSRSADSVMINGTVADSSGLFRIKSVPKGEYFLTVSFIGYQKKFIHGIHLAENKKEVQMDTVFLEEASTNLKEVNIKAERNLVEYKIDRKIVNASQQLNAQGGTAVDLLRNVSSVTVDAEGNVAIRGSSNFRLLIDGRPATIQGSEGLQQIPASSVENIEIITNPSAKYDPDGTAGIINVIMKKIKKKGISGVVNASVGLNEKYAGDALLNFKLKKAGFFFGAELNDRTYRPYSLYHREYYLQDTTRYVTYETFRKGNPRNYTFRTGLDYDINENSAIGISADYNITRYYRGFSNHNVDWLEPGTGINYFLATDDLSVYSNYINANLNYQHRFPQKQHTLDAFITVNHVYNKFDEDFSNAVANSSFEPIGNPYLRNVGIENYRHAGQLKVDYVKPFTGDYKLEAGFQVDILSKNVDYRNDVYDSLLRTWVMDSLMTYKYDYTQNIDAVYLTFSGALFGFGYQFGLRGEYYQRDLKQQGTGISYPMDMINIFPSFHVQRSLPLEQEIQIGYSRRVNRPDDRSLSPFFFYADQYTVQVGNPGLKPEFIDSYEFNYQKKFTWGSVDAGNYYRQTNDGFYQVIKLGPDQRLWLTSANMSRDYAIGLELSANITVTKWWKLNPGIDVSNYTQKANVEGQPMSSNNNLFNSTLTNTFTIAENTRMQVSWVYVAPMNLVEGNFIAQNSVNASVRQDFLKKRISLNLSANDIFSTQNFVFDMHRPAFRVYGGYYPESPTVTLSLSYKFNEFRGRKKNRGPDGNFESGF